jgi:hypothetical protein
VQLAFRGDGFGKRRKRVGFVKQGLALEIRGFNEIAVNDTQFSDAGAC